MNSGGIASQQLAILGGGQLGLMLIQKAYDFNISCHVLDPDPEAPCKNIAVSFTCGDLTDFDTVYNFGKDKSTITIEIENVNTDALEKLEKEGKKVFPQPAVLRIIKDKGLQKQFYTFHKIPTSPYQLVAGKNEITSFPIVQKLRTGGYDGKGVQVLRSADDLAKAFDAPSLLEELVDIDKEIAVIVSRNEQGEVAAYPSVEMEFNPEANLVELLFSPSDIPAAIEQKAQEIAKEIAKQLAITGLLAVEFFITKKGELLVNEIAPRPHNSGHQTIEGNITSQYEQHLRAIFGEAPGSTDIKLSSVMVNLLGEPGYDGAAVFEGMPEILAIPGVHVHLYGKKITRPFRKMGHVTVVDQQLSKAKEKAYLVKEKLKSISNKKQ